MTSVPEGVAEIGTATGFIGGTRVPGQTGARGIGSVPVADGQAVLLEIASLSVSRRLALLRDQA